MRSGLKILLVTPAPPGSRTGNRVTARRWREILTDLGHEVVVAEEYPPGAGPEHGFDLLVALHAARSAPSIERYRAENPSAPLILACTGTDLYRDLREGDPAAVRSLERADRLVVLHPLALDELPAGIRSRTRVIVQSVRLPWELSGPGEGEAGRPQPPGHGEHPFRVLVAAHLREVKDPLRGALAAELLPSESAVRVLHCGGVLEPELEAEARRLAGAGGRYRWLGELDRLEVLRHMAASHCLLISSRMEGAPNVLSEALALGVPVLATDIPGCVGLLGADHPALYPPGDTRSLARLLRRVETDADLYRELAERSRTLAPSVHPAAERAAWLDLLDEVSAEVSSRPGT